MSNEITIWKYLKANGLTDAGTAGLMGNLQAESALNPQNLQNTFEKKLGFTDEAYTRAVDAGVYTNFVKDSAGYGLAQWTYWTRKQNLLDFAKKQGKSIGDLQMQLDFLLKEISGYKNMMAILKTTDSIREASDAVLLQYERPADQSEAVQIRRATLGQEIYNRQRGNVEMSNSSLVVYTKISPNKTSPRNHIIDTISIHCMAGNLTVETCGNVFAPSSRQASSNYGIGSDGRIALYVDEKDRSWCTSNKENDHRAITIEVANDGGADTGWHVSDKAMASLINLCVDICKRNGIKKLLWKNDKSLIGQVDKQNMTVHRWFANKSCPGDYLMSKHGYIAEEVNKRLGASSSEPEEKPQETTGLYRIRKTWQDAKSQVGAYKNLAGAKEECDKHPGYSVFDSNGNKIYPMEKPQAFKEYTVMVTCDTLNVRKGPGTNYGTATSIRKGEVYTIVGEQNGWGKLKSGAGWISLSYTQKR